MAHMRLQEEFINEAITSTNNIRHTITELKAHIIHFGIPKEDVFINTDAADFLIKELFSVLLGEYRNADVVYRVRAYDP